jgi:hypothetical protein
MTTFNNEYNPYQAPELVGNVEEPSFINNFPADLYSLGILIWEIFHKTRPQDSKEVDKKSGSNLITKPIWTLNEPKYAPLKELYELLTTWDKTDRINKLKGVYLESSGNEVSISKLIDALEIIESKFLTPIENIESKVWDAAVENENVKDMVHWSKFEAEFEKYYPVTLKTDKEDKSRKCLKELMGARVMELVTKANWQRFNGWFSHMLGGEKEKKSSKGKKIQDFLSNLEELYTKDYFHGFLTTDTASSKIMDIKSDKKNSKSTIFLIRLDEEKKNELSIMYTYEGVQNVVEQIIAIGENDTLEVIVTKCDDAQRNLKKKHGKACIAVAGPGKFVFSSVEGGGGNYVTMDLNQ